jgi:hypothetical protein
MANPSMVWMVHARTAMTGVKGALDLEDGVLVFHPQNVSRGDTRIPVAGIKRSRRVRGTPILEIYPSSDSLPTVIGFYFVEPPQIGHAGEPTTPMGAMNPFRKHAGRRAALRKLRLANGMKKDEVQAWVERLGRGGVPHPSGD